MTKSELRRLLKNIRPSKAQSAQVLKHLRAHSLWQDAGLIAAYMPLANEIAINPLSLGKKIALPKITPSGLEFYQIDNHTPLSINRFGIYEPEAGILCRPEELQLVLLPMLGFSTDCYRLGYGGGYYDRYFSTKRSATMLGLAVEEQKITALPLDSWDVQLDLIVTDKGYYKP